MIKPKTSPASSPSSSDAFSDGTEAVFRRDEKSAPAIVRVKDVTAAPSEFFLRTGSCTVGSAPPCDIVIQESSVSRTHLTLTLVPEGVLVEDRGSRNGTFYLGQRIERLYVGLGSRIQVGRVTIALDADEAALAGGATPYEEDMYGRMIGTSRAMKRLFGLLVRLEGSLVPVLVSGESGVGKELVAEALHEKSKASGGAFVAVNCGAFAKELIASELFGHVKGAFTGAVASRKGAFESADEGTLFLDEIGELPLDVQPSLLRVLETGEVRPVGGDTVRKVRVRLVAATHRDLRAEVEAGRFREDLYYRLAVVKLRVPPLRERPEDIDALARHFATQVGLLDLDAKTLQRFRSMEWPGNVRELRNAVQALAALGDFEGGESKGAHLDDLLAASVDCNRSYADQKEALVERFTRVYLRALLAQTKGNQSAAARLAGLDRTYLGRLLVKYGLG
ncbi:MAG: sigma 54-interacting transcriptional regulator [Polyangiaceae bacterium]